MLNLQNLNKPLDIHGKYFEIDDTVDIGNFCSLHGGYTKETALKIGAFTYVAVGVVLMAITHEFKKKDQTITNQGMVTKGLIIGRDCWIGAHVVIMPGLTIGDGAIVGAGAVVTHDIPPYEIWAGVPAKKIGERE